MNQEEFKLPLGQKASLVSLVCEKFESHSTVLETNNSLRELRELLKTLGLIDGEEYVQNRKQLDPATMLGEGKLREIADAAREEGSTVLVFDFELTASQIRNIKEITKMEVVDRNTVILEIFAHHARTKEAKIQIEISRLQYLLPRLTAMWGHFSKQRSAGAALGGEGEQQLELDRRMVRERIEFYKRQLEEVQKSREQQRKKRQNQAVTAALVGYTNAGKSSLMNRLCKVNVLEENKLFATLDSTFRTLNPDSKPPMIMIDTVGFISNLPNTLIQGFKTTLESALEADLLVIVCDISDPNYQKHLRVTQEVLKELKIEEKQQIIVFNKKDLLNDPVRARIIMRNYPNSFLVSSYDEEDMKNLREYIINFFLSKQDHYDLFVPYEAGEAHSRIRGNANIINSVSHEQGIFYRIRIPDFIFQQLGLNNFILAPSEAKDWENPTSI
ncbi:GTPase HflX [Peredibacter sp. HCB2-198]|uniref:GTPase HflX n=1 Tax=Peredibacter sp. HCB2-198 TaxID=3383025 RepID=UPI0038B5E184